MKSQSPINPAPVAANSLTLRQRAESQWQSVGRARPDAFADLSIADFQTLLHDLQVHQIELDLQNEELRQARDAADASRARYVDLYDLAPVGYCSVSEAGLILLANLTLASLLRVARSALTRSRPLSHFIVRTDQNIWYQTRALLLESGEPQRCEVRLRQASAGMGGGVGDEAGASVWVQLVATVAQEGESGRVLHIAVSDIGALKNADEALRQSQRTLAFNTADLQLFSEVTAHHLQEPVRRLASYAGLLGKQLVGKQIDPEVQRSLDFIGQQARYLQNLLRDVQRYLVADQPLGTLQRVDIRAVVRRVVDGLDLRMIASGARIDVAELPPVWFDAARLGEVFELLLDNALRHGGAVGVNAGEAARALHITVGGERIGSVVRLRVSDNGPGIETQYRERVFRAFERLQSGSTDSGVGLALVRRIVESGGGRAWIDETPGGGCSVWFELPQAERAP